MGADSRIGRYERWAFHIQKSKNLRKLFGSDHLLLIVAVLVVSFCGQIVYGMVDDWIYMLMQAPLIMYVLSILIYGIWDEIDRRRRR